MPKRNAEAEIQQSKTQAPSRRKRSKKNTFPAPILDEDLIEELDLGSSNNYFESYTVLHTDAGDTEVLSSPKQSVGLLPSLVEALGIFTFDEDRNAGLEPEGLPW